MTAVAAAVAVAVAAAAAVADDTPPLTLTGTYKLQSTYDISSERAGHRRRRSSTTFIDATDDADDPTAWILQQIANALPSGTIRPR